MSSSTDQSPDDTARLHTPVRPQCTYRWRCPVLQLPHTKSPSLTSPDGSDTDDESSRVVPGGARLTHAHPAGGRSVRSGSGSTRRPVRTSKRTSDTDDWSRLCTCAKRRSESSDHRTLARYSSESPLDPPGPTSTSIHVMLKSDGFSRAKYRSRPV